jgi:hypothetical protein
MTMTTKTGTTASGVSQWTRMIRVTGVVGLVSFVLLFVPIIAISSLGEPPFVASAEEIRAFFVNSSAGWVQAATTLTRLAAIGLIWFVAGLSLLLGRAEGSPPWRAVVVLVSGAMLPAYLLLEVSWDAASFGIGDLDLAVASFAFDAGNLGFANVWLAMASFVVACGWVVLSTRVVGRWLGWWAIASGLGLVISRFVWTSAIWFPPYAAFWIWVIILCVKLIRRPAAMLSAADGRNRQVGELP